MNCFRHWGRLNIVPTWQLGLGAETDRERERESKAGREREAFAYDYLMRIHGR